MLSRLKQMAQQQAEILQTRDEVIGLGIYGSLAYNRVTPFSDLDIFIITAESEHNPDIEHRLRDGIRIDFIWETLERWQQIQYAPPSYMPWYLVKALLLAQMTSFFMTLKESSEICVLNLTSARLPQPIAINNNIAIGGQMWPKARNDYWAMMIGGKVEVGNYAYKPGPHVYLYQSDGSYFTPEGCWIAAWNEDINEVYGFTFSPNCGCIVARGTSTDFEFYLPAGESTLRFHVTTPKTNPPYLALQQWACSEEPIPLSPDEDGKGPRSPYATR